MNQLDRKWNIVRKLEPNLNVLTNAEKNKLKTHCKYGHEFTKENTYINGKNGRSCKICVKENKQKRILNNV